MKKVVILERKTDIRDAISWAKSVDAEVTFISLSPEISWNLEKVGISFKTPKDYVNEAEIYRQGLENFTKVRNITEILDNQLSTIYPDLPINPAEYAFRQIKILCDVLYTTISILQGIVEQENPDIIRIYAPQCNATKSSDLKNEESIYLSILRLDGWAVDIEIVDCPSDQTPRKWIKTESNNGMNLNEWLQTKPFLYNLGMITKRNGKYATFRSLIQKIIKPFGPTLLLYGNGYNWDDSLPELFNYGFTSIIRIRDDWTSISTSEEKQHISSVKKICTDNMNLHEFEHFKGINISPIIFTKVATIVSHSIAESIGSYERAVELIHKHHVGAFLLAHHITPLSFVLLKAAHDCSVPVISWQHGGGGYSFHPMMPFVEYVGSDIHLVFGEGVAESYRKTNDNLKLTNPPRYVPVGSSSLDRLGKSVENAYINSDEKKLRVLYATTLYIPNNDYYISHRVNQVAYNESLWLVQRLMIDLAKHNPDVDFIIKLHPRHTSMEPLKNYAKEQDISNIAFISNERNLTDLLPESDIIIFDLISTGILQALQTNLPVFAYTELIRPDDEVLCPLSKRVYCYDDPGEFIDNIDAFLKTQKSDHNVNIKNRDFISSFGVHSDDGLSAERAAQILKETICHHS